MGGIRDSPNENYTMSEMATLSWEMLKEEWYERGPTKNFLGDFYQDIAKHGQLTQQEVIAVVIVAVLFTIHRHLFTKLFLNVSIAVEVRFLVHGIPILTGRYFLHLSSRI